MKKKNTKQNKTKNAEYMVENFKVLFLRNSRELGFLCDFKNLFMMLLS